MICDNKQWWYLIGYFHWSYCDFLLENNIKLYFILCFLGSVWYLNDRVSHIGIYLVFTVLWAIKGFKHDQVYNYMIYKTDIVTMLFIYVTSLEIAMWHQRFHLVVSNKKTEWMVFAETAFLAIFFLHFKLHLKLGNIFFQDQKI